MNKILFFVLSIFIFAGTVQADDNFYIQGFGNLSFMNDSDVTLDLEGQSGELQAETDSDLGAGVEIGFKPMKNILTGIEYSARTFDVTRFNGKGGSIEVPEYKNCHPLGQSLQI